MTGAAPGDRPPPAWHAMPWERAAELLGNDADRGLSLAEAERRLRQFGENTLSRGRGRSPVVILLAQFASLIVLLLAAAGVAALVMGEFPEAIAILMVIVLNGLIGFVTEFKAERALAALEKQTAALAHVIREGGERQIPASQVVVGDLVVLAAGGRAPADGRIVECVRLMIQEAALTGESEPVEKTASVLDDADAPLAERRNMAYLGTVIADGRGRMLVTATGKNTEVGRIGLLLQETQDEETPLEQRLARLGRWLVVIVLAVCAVIVASGWLRGHPLLEMFKIGVSLAIAAVPEGLPAVATMTLALGMQRMARRKALIRRLPAVETLGSTTVICTDKTGTLTRNEMTVRAVLLDERRVDISGAGYDPSGEFRVGSAVLDPAEEESLLLALRVGALCNDAAVDRQDTEAAVLGDPTEAALIVAATKAGMSVEELRDRYPRLEEIPFDSAAQWMATLHASPEGQRLVCVKGGPSAVLSRCAQVLGREGPQPLTPKLEQLWRQRNDELAGGALRVLALAVGHPPKDASLADSTGDLTFVGLVGMQDPLREEARQAIDVCRQAGVRTIMITGDQERTAAEIARQLGIDRDAHGRPLRTVHGRELKGLDEQGWREVAAQAAVFARVSPEHKLRIVESLQQQGEIVAMTGDGVNDAPALKKANIGVAMGVKGAEVTKETADMIILDDNFATIVGAIEQGRIIYSNILRFVHYLFSCNLSEIITVFVAILIGWPLPLAALQMLWLNMITDVFPALALALEPSSPGMMHRPPRDPASPLVSPRLAALIGAQGLLLAATTLAAFAVGLNWYGYDPAGNGRPGTMVFMTLALAQTFHAFSARSQRRSAFDRYLFTNAWLWAAVGACVSLQLLAVYAPPLRAVLNTTPLAAADWAVVLALSLAPVAVIEIAKKAGTALHGTFSVHRSATSR